MFVCLLCEFALIKLWWIILHYDTAVSSVLMLGHKKLVYTPTGAQTKTIGRTAVYWDSRCFSHSRIGWSKRTQRGTAVSQAARKSIWFQPISDWSRAFCSHILSDNHFSGTWYVAGSQVPWPTLSTFKSVGDPATLVANSQKMQPVSWTRPRPPAKGARQ